MELWLDTLETAAILEAKKLGLLEGVTTNPTILSKSIRSARETVVQLLEIQEGTVAVQVAALKPDEMIAQGKALHALSSRILVKVPATKEGLAAIYALSSEGIPTCATAIYQPTQVWLASEVGAAYASFYLSKIERGGERTKEILENFVKASNGKIKLLAASLRTPEHVKYCTELGVHAVTLKEDLFADLMETYELTLGAVEQFAEDWKQAKHPLPF